MSENIKRFPLDFEDLSGELETTDVVMIAKITGESYKAELKTLMQQSLSGDVLTLNDRIHLGFGLNTDNAPALSVTGVKCFKYFKLNIFDRDKVNDYYVYALYNWADSHGVSFLYIGKDVDGLRTSVVRNGYSVQEIENGIRTVLHLTDGAGYLEFELDTIEFGGNEPAELITYLHENENVKIPIKAEYTEKYNLTGKRVLWLGTSIPESGTYPENSCATVGATCINGAVGASFIRLGELTPATSIATDSSDIYRATGLSQTVAEKDAIWGSKTTEWQLNYAKLMSYENKLIPYLSGDDKVDYIIIDHGFNDRYPESLGVEADIDAMNRDTFIGAMSFIINEIRKTDFRIKIIIVAHYDNTYPFFNTANLVTAQELVASKLGVPILRTYEKTGFSGRLVPGTSALSPTYPHYGTDESNNLSVTQCWLPDGLHYHSDTTGKSQAHASEIFTAFLKNI